MTAVSDVNSPLVAKCMDFCQALAIQGQTFHFSLNMGPSFSFSLDTRGKAMTGLVSKKKESPSTQRRNARRREEFLSKKRQTPSTVDSTVEKAAVSSFHCDQCDYTNASEKGLRPLQALVVLGFKLAIDNRTAADVQLGRRGRQCLVLRGTTVSRSCKWAPTKRGVLPRSGGMRTPPERGRTLSSC